MSWNGQNQSSLHWRKASKPKTLIPMDTVNDCQSILRDSVNTLDYVRIRLWLCAGPDSILLKPDRLTESEWMIMHEHPVTGEKICRPLKSFHLVLPIIRHHHEKLNGTGYPDGLKGDDIPLTARILQIVDVYDALTTKRPYKKELTTAEAFSIMEHEVKCGWWDRDLFEQFQHEITTPEKRSTAAVMPITARQRAS